MVPEEESIVKSMILKRNLFLFDRQNDGPFDGPRQQFVEWFECWKSQQRSKNFTARQRVSRNRGGIWHFRVVRLLKWTFIAHLLIASDLAKHRSHRNGSLGYS